MTLVASLGRDCQELIGGWGEWNALSGQRSHIIRHGVEMRVPDWAVHRRSSRSDLLAVNFGDVDMLDDLDADDAGSSVWRWGDVRSGNVSL